jgi:GNAT superfamily N-acetyltransferase
MKVIGYYSLAAGVVRREESPVCMARGLAKHPIGVILLARLAVDSAFHGQGIGRILLADAMFRAAAAADIIGARAILVHALDDGAVSFYANFGFQPSPLDPKRFLLLMKDLRSTLQSFGLQQ